MEIFDLAVIGGGPAGYTAAIYAARAGLSCVVYEKSSPGGQMGVTSIIENYPGCPSVEGFELAMKMQKQAESLGASFRHEAVTAVNLAEKTLTSAKGSTQTKAIVLATGASPRLLGVPGEAEYTGRGVSYCATCDGMFFRGKTVVVNGGGDTAFEDAMYLAGLCREVILVHRRDTFRAARTMVARAEKKDNITFVKNTVIEEILGDGRRVNAVRLKDTVQATSRICETDGVFVAVGRIPETSLFAGQIALDRGGYIAADESTVTSVPGVFAAGDVRTKTLRQIVTACADGASAVRAAQEWLDQQ